jgi:hypothetical protein
MDHVYFDCLEPPVDVSPENPLEVRRETGVDRRSLDAFLDNTEQRGVTSNDNVYSIAQIVSHQVETYIRLMKDTFNRTVPIIHASNVDYHNTY